MNYLKTAADVVNYTPRVDIDSGKELIYSNVASRLIDRYCNQSLAIQYYLKDFELNGNLVGRIPAISILEVTPTTLSTGFQIRALGKTANGARCELGDWVDIEITNPVESLINLRTGRLELFRNLTDDYNRVLFARLYEGLGLSVQRSAYSWLAKIEITAGFLAETTVASAVSNGATTATLASVKGISVGTQLNFNNTLTVNTVSAVDTSTKIVTLSPALTALSVGTAVSQVVPEDIKMATGMVIEDRILYEPNTIRQQEKLDVIIDRFQRMSTSPIPVDAQFLLQKYRNG